MTMRGVDHPPAPEPQSASVAPMADLEPAPVVEPEVTAPAPAAPEAFVGTVNALGMVIATSAPSNVTTGSRADVWAGASVKVACGGAVTPLGGTSCVVVVAAGAKGTVAAATTWAGA